MSSGRGETAPTRRPMEMFYDVTARCTLHINDENVLLAHKMKPLIFVLER